MAKKVGMIIPDSGAISTDGVRETAGSAFQSNVRSVIGAEIIAPLVDANALHAQDANDGTEDGDQPSFSMPSFGNGPDVRKRG